ncbi:MAG: aminotransferase class I/II-fold pyridoxal phosphate-dependent enzyme [Chlorobi bacterium CHB2]|nr:aminotransferase class I/II-fold pyridoxal phosphate-dependent enzyme [Chlorobi bacterium CHB2]
MTQPPAQRPIDLRSDTVTKPTPGMIEAMLLAQLGDDVYSEDPTVNQLEEYVADLLGHEAALFVPTGVMGNQLCLKVLTNPGNEVLLGERSHIFNYETGAPALLSGVQVHTLPDDDGWMELPAIEAAIREDAYYLPQTTVIAVEQTHNRAGGSVIPMEHLRQIVELGRGKGIGLHLDGARLWNACVATGISPRQYASQFDTVSVCLSKGLGAPIGSVMASTAERVTLARKFRKVWGGGWRQAGILAACGLFGLRHQMDRLREDHQKAACFAEILSHSPMIEIPRSPETNIVVFKTVGFDLLRLADVMKGEGVWLSTAFKGLLRAVFHHDVTLEQSAHAAQAIVAALERNHKVAAGL